MKRRYYYMDLLNILSTFAVVMLHSSSFAFSNAAGWHWDLAVTLQVLFIFAVPIFFMISGANILDYRTRETTSVFFRKRLKRIAVPFLMWSIVWFLYFNHYDWHYSLLKLNTYNIFIDKFLHGNVQPIFWFFYVIIGFYLSAPVLTKIFNVENKRTIEYLILLNVIIVALIGYYYQLRQQPALAFESALSIGSAGSIGIFSVGWYLQHFSIGKYKKYLYIFGIFSVICMVVLTIHLSHVRGQYQSNVYSIWGVFGLAWSTTIFYAFKDKFNDWQPSEKVQRIIREMASASLGVYVIHYFMIDHIDRYHLIAVNSIKHMIIVPFVVWGCSILITILIKKIPFLRRAV